VSCRLEKPCKQDRNTQRRERNGIPYGFIDEKDFELINEFLQNPIYKNLLGNEWYPIGEDEAGNIVFYHQANHLHLFDHEMSIDGKSYLHSTYQSLKGDFRDTLNPVCRTTQKCL
jgi:hypothetical protein